MSEVALAVARDQLGRMRGMTAMYHRRFYSDVWLTAALYFGVFAVAELGADGAVVVLPFIALFGATITAFDASYLVFARQYASRLEVYINERIGEEVLIGGRLEDTYLFPLDRPKVVTIAAGSGFSWFGWVTVSYTAMGIIGYLFGMVLALEAIATTAAVVWLLVALLPLTAATLVVGLWWFVGGEGEARLRSQLDAVFGPRTA